MSKTLTEIAQQIKECNKKVQLIYAFNGSGKTRLSREFVRLVAPKDAEGEDGAEAEATRTKILYYNALTEDLFYWDNDLENDAEPRLKIQRNSFTDWILREQGQDQNIIGNFQRYVSNKLTPQFNEDFSEVIFSLERGDDARTGNLKISKGEESNFIWSIFYTLLDQVIAILKQAEPELREDNQFDNLEYVFIDDPVSSLDENHLIELAVNIAALIIDAPDSLKFILTTHNPLFYNVLHNELNSPGCYLLKGLEDGNFELHQKQGGSNKSFSYHLYLKQTLETAIAEGRVEKYHFTLLRNLYEKTAHFLGYAKWGDLLNTAEGDREAYLRRIMHYSSHRTLSHEEVAEPSDQEKQTVGFLLDNLTQNYGYWREEQPNG